MLAVVLALGLGQTPPAAEPSPAVREVLVLNERLEAAIAGGEADRIAPFFAPEFRLQNAANRILTGPQVLEQFRKGASRFASYERKVEAAYEAGPVVVLMGEERVRAAQPDGTPAAETTRRFTSVWRRTDGGWAQAARQSTTADPAR